MYNPYLDPVPQTSQNSKTVSEHSRLSQLWQSLKPDTPDSGDTLLLLILLLLLLEEEKDDPELLLTLGLTLLQ